MSGIIVAFTSFSFGKIHFRKETLVANGLKKILDGTYAATLTLRFGRIVKNKDSISFLTIIFIRGLDSDMLGMLKIVICCNKRLVTVEKSETVYYFFSNIMRDCEMKRGVQVRSCVNLALWISINLDYFNYVVGIHLRSCFGVPDRRTWSLFQD